MTKNLEVINNALSEADINLYVSNEEMINLNAAMRNKHEEDPSKLPEVQFSRKWLYRVFNEDFKKGGRSLRWILGKRYRRTIGQD